MVDMDRHLECSEAQVVPPRPAHDILNPINPRDGEPCAVGKTAQGQWVFLMPTPNHAGFRFRQNGGLCDGNHSAELERELAAGNIVFEDRGALGCKVAVWATKRGD